MSDGDEIDPKIEFVFERAPYSEVLYLINDGAAKKVKPSDLAKEIRKHGFLVMPEPVQDLVCDMLEGKIERRGREGLSISQKVQLAQRYAMHYRAIYAYIRGAEVGVPALVEFVGQNLASLPENIPTNEKAWRLVSLFVTRNDNHYAAMANLVSEFAPLKQNS